MVTMQQPTVEEQFVYSGAYEGWKAQEVKPGEAPRRCQVEAVFDGRAPGYHIPGVVPSVTCRTAYQALNKLTRTSYDGTADNLSAGIGTSHWMARYSWGNTAEAWQRYFDDVGLWDEQRRQVLGPVFGMDPLDQMTNVLQSILNAPVERLIHPRFGREMGAGLIRSGEAKRHVDNATWDVPIEADGHIGAVLILNSAPGAKQRVYRAQLSAPIEATGNYDLDQPKDVAVVDLPSTTGSLSLVSAPFVHEVIDHADRLTLAIHVIRTPMGSYRYYA